MDGILKIKLAIDERTAVIGCDHLGQNVTVALVNGEYLHEGSIQCPSCDEICGKENCTRQSKDNVNKRSAKAIDTKLNQKAGVNETLVCDISSTTSSSMLKDFLGAFGINL